MDLMEFLYRVMEELSNAGVPIVFKGVMVLNLAIRENNPSKVERATRDIGGDWVGYRTHPMELGEAYDKMKGIKNKPDFIEVYNRVSDVICKLEPQRKVTIFNKEKSR